MIADQVQTHSASLEKWECRSCLHAGALNVHGRCAACDSDFVVSQEVISARSRHMSRLLAEARKYPLVMMEMGAA